MIATTIMRQPTAPTTATDNLALTLDDVIRPVPHQLRVHAVQMLKGALDLAVVIVPWRKLPDRQLHKLLQPRNILHSGQTHHQIAGF